ncbi:MAG: hypothetical protein H0S79_05160 [Anaerolineaceae bacterium]|nr:hypothetical protein [Anaerolineaceae bacterium]
MLWETPNRTYINENNQIISVNQDNHKVARTMIFVMRSYWRAHLPSGGRHLERTLLLYECRGYKVTGSKPGVWSFRDDEGNIQHMVEPAWRMMKRIKGRE